MADRRYVSPAVEALLYQFFVEAVGSQPFPPTITKWSDTLERVIRAEQEIKEQ